MQAASRGYLPSVAGRVLVRTILKFHELNKIFLCVISRVFGDFLLCVVVRLVLQDTGTRGFTDTNPQDQVTR